MNVGEIEILGDRLADTETGWAFGAIAEFTRDTGEAFTSHRDDGHLTMATNRGALQITPGADLRLFASEAPPKTAGANVSPSACRRMAAP